MIEREVENPVVQWARQHGILVVKLNLLGHRSMPDRLFLLPAAHAVFIEFKRPGGKPTKLQQRRHTLLLELGYDVKVYDNSDAAIRYLAQTLDAATVHEGMHKAPARTRLRRVVSKSRRAQD